MSATLIADRYVLTEQLGAGGMGDVFRAVDHRTDAAVAIKVLKPDLTTPEMVMRFKREADTLRQLNHPNIVHLLDFIDENERYYLIMELVDGGSSIRFSCKRLGCRSVKSSTSP